MRAPTNLCHATVRIPRPVNDTLDFLLSKSASIRASTLGNSFSNVHRTLIGISFVSFLNFYRKQLLINTTFYSHTFSDFPVLNVIWIKVKMNKKSDFILMFFSLKLNLWVERSVYLQNTNDDNSLREYRNTLKNILLRSRFTKPAIAIPASSSSTISLSVI